MATTSTSVPLEDELAAIDLAVGWPATDVPRAVATELAESSGDPTIVNWDGVVPDTNGLSIPDADFPYYATGLFQNLSDHDTDPGAAENVGDPTWLAEMENPVENSAEALTLFQASGWEPWDTDIVNNGQNSAGAQQDLAEGEQGLSDVEQGGSDNAELTNVITWIGQHFITGTNPAGSIGVPIGAAARAAADAATGNDSAAASALASAAPSLTTGWAADALKIAAGAAGAVLIILGLYTAGGSAKNPEQKS